MRVYQHVLDAGPQTVELLEAILGCGLEETFEIYSGRRVSGLKPDSGEKHPSRRESRDALRGTSASGRRADLQPGAGSEVCTARVLARAQSAGSRRKAAPRGETRQGTTAAKAANRLFVVDSPPHVVERYATSSPWSEGGSKTGPTVKGFGRGLTRDLAGPHDPWQHGANGLARSPPGSGRFAGSTHRS
jgi:hypothetical protein